MQTIDEKLKVIKAFLERKEIEYSYNDGRWILLNPEEFLLTVLNHKDYEFRIKQEPKYVPYTFEDNKIFRDEWFRHKNGDFCKIQKYWNTAVSIADAPYYYKELFVMFTDEDGNPAGKLLE